MFQETKRALLTLAFLLGLLTSLGQGPARADTHGDVPTADVQAIQKIIRDYLIENPEVLIEAMQAYEAKRKIAEAEQQILALQQSQAELFQDDASPVIGPSEGDITIVEFFDYRCPYCKVTATRLRQAMAEDAGLRVVMKEFPILSEESEVGARAALAAAAQGQYEAFHFALMEQPGDMSERHLRVIAKKTGVDPDQMFEDMEDPALKVAIGKNRALARRLRISGTPALLIGDKIIPGAIELEELRALIASVRANAS